MRSSWALPLSALTALAALLAAASPLHAAASNQAAPAPQFQALANGKLFVFDPTAVLTNPLPLQAGYPAGSFSLTGLAAGPAGETFVAGTDSVANSWLWQVDFGTGAATSVGAIPGYVIADIAFDGAGRLYGLTDNGVGGSPHSLLLIDTATAAAAVVKVLDNHGGPEFGPGYGALGFNPADGSLYYAFRDSTYAFFLDKLAPGTFEQTRLQVPNNFDPAIPTAMVFSQGSLWLFISAGVYSADPANLAAGFSFAGIPILRTRYARTEFDQDLVYVDGAIPSLLPCHPGPTVACLQGRFEVKVYYDATPGGGSGPANVALAGRPTAELTFLDPESTELIVKVIDGCTLNSHWWIFAGGLTDAGVSLKVTDRLTRTVKVYQSPKGEAFQSIGDTSAFSCP
jgi:hypothetical protein